MIRETAEPTFPDWVPPEAVSRWREACRELERRRYDFDKWIEEFYSKSHHKKDNDFIRTEREQSVEFEVGIRDLIYRLITDQEMREVWRVLGQAKPKGSVKQSQIFIACVIRAWHGPHGEERWAPAERQRWRKDVAALALELAEKLKSTGADWMLIKQYANAKLRYSLNRAFSAGISGESAPNSSGEFGWRAPLLSSLLENLAQSAELYLEPARLERPKSDKARRAYFVRYLADYFREEFKGPRLKILAITTRVALEDSEVEERQISRLLSTTNDGKRANSRRKRQ